MLFFGHTACMYYNDNYICNLKVFSIISNSKMNFSNIAFIVICVISHRDFLLYFLLCNGVFLGVKITPKLKWGKNYSIKKV